MQTITIPAAMLKGKANRKMISLLLAQGVSLQVAR